MTGIHVIIAVWGAGHTAAFVDVGLPSLMASGNLPAMAELADLRLQLFTKKSDFETIAASPAYRKLCETTSVDLEFIDENFEVAPHTMMSECHRAGLKAAYARGAYAVFVPPECVWSDGSMKRLAEIAERGVAVVHMSGLRLIKETVAPKLSAGWLSADGSTIAIPARDLVRAGLDHLHPITRDLFYREHGSALMPANLLWTVPDQGILARCFHLHPLMVEANERNSSFKTTIDDDLGLVSDPTGARDYVVTDSDEIFAYELSSLTHKVQAAFRKGSIAEIAAWAEVGMNFRHRLLAQHTIRIHTAELDADLWAPLERESDQVVEGAMRLVDKPSWQLALRGLWRNLEFRHYAAKIRSTPYDPKAANYRPMQAARLQAEAAAAEAAGESTEALRLYDEAIVVSPPNTALHYLRGTLLMKLDQIDSALTDFNIALTLEPRNASLRHLKAQIEHLIRVREYGASIAAETLNHLNQEPPNAQSDLHGPKASIWTRPSRTPLNHRVRHISSWARYLAISLPARVEMKAFRYFAALTRFFTWIFGSNEHVRPWHWRWSYEKKVLLPLKSELARSGEPALFIQEDSVPDISFESLTALPTLEKVSCSHALSSLRLQRHSQVILSHGRILNEHPDLTIALREAVLSSGDLRLTILDHSLTADILANLLGPDIALEQQATYGKAGTAWVSNFVRRVRRQTAFIWMLSFVNGGHMLRRLLLFPVPLIGALITFPTMSAIDSLLDKYGRGNTVAAVTIRLMSKIGRVAGASGMATAANRAAIHIPQDT